MHLQYAKQSQFSSEDKSWRTQAKAKELITLWDGLQIENLSDEVLALVTLSGLTTYFTRDLFLFTSMYYSSTLAVTICS